MNELTLSSLRSHGKDLLSGQYWGELRIFAEVARAKSFNRAAERLNLSQPTIGRKVRRLQDLIGAQLFVATKTGIRLTQRGEELADALLAFDQSLYAIATDLRARDRDAEGVVSISLTDGMAAVFAAPAIPEFAARFPRIQLQLCSIANLNELRDNHTDMMLTFAPSDRSDVVCRRLGALSFTSIASQSYVARHGMPTRATIGEHFIVQSRLYMSDSPVWRNWQALSATARISHYCDNSFAYAMLVRQGLGIGLLGTYTTREKTAVPVDLGVETALPIYAVALSERLGSRQVQIVFDWLCEVFGEDNPWFRSNAKQSEMPGTLSSLDQVLGV